MLLRWFRRAIAKQRPRWGRRPSAKQARRPGWKVNDKRVRRAFGLPKGCGAAAIPQEAPVGCLHPCRGEVPDRAERVVCVDLPVRHCGHGRALKIQRDRRVHPRVPHLHVDRSFGADQVVEALEVLTAQCSAPRFVRFDNGPEFAAHAVADRCRFNRVDTVFIDPGSPWQSAWIESINGRSRDVLLNGRQFDKLLEARVTIKDWRIDYNINRPTLQRRPHPAEFAAAWTIDNQPQAE